MASTHHTADTAFAEYTDRWALTSGLAVHTLAGPWYIRSVEAFHQGFYFADEGEWLSAQVPGHWQQHPDLANFAGNVVYRHHFSLPLAPEATHTDGKQPDRFWLRLNGIFYWSEPHLNGTALGRHEGYFEPYEHEVTGLLRDENTLLVEVECPDEHNKFNKRMLTGVFSHWDCFDPLSNPGGIWLPVEVLRSGPVRLHHVRCHTDSFNDTVAQLRYTADVDAAVGGPALLRWTIAPRTFEGATQTIEQRRTLRAGRQQISGLFKLRDPHLWWTHDLGNPDLYTITLDIVFAGDHSDRFRFVFGVRHFELRNWIPHLNGVRFLVKGSNYAPGDMRIATMNLERCMQDLRLAQECNMNLLRVHAHIDHPALYHAADMLGILLWQDMPLQWLYHPDVLSHALHQARAMVQLLYNHPSVAIWCMHNEPLFVGDTADETVPTRLRTYGSTFGFSWNRDVMDTQLKRVTEEEDPQRPVVRSSGELYVPYVREGTDAHAYFGWYSSYGTLADAENLRRRMPTNLRFVTEFGAQSFPNLESCQRFMPADITEIDFEYLAQRHSFQGDVMHKWIPWREAASLEELVRMTQDYQMFINRYYVDRLRYYKYRPTGGIVPFVFLDPYPAVLWSIVDYWRVPKQSYYALRMAFSPQYAFSIFDPRVYQLAEPVDLPVYVVNDAQQQVTGAQLTTRLCNPEGADIAVVEHTLSLEADCQAREIDRLRLTPTMRGRYTLDVSLTGVEQETHQVYHVEVG
jgi:beta-mannosidase